MYAEYLHICPPFAIRNKIAKIFNLLDDFTFNTNVMKHVGNK